MRCLISFALLLGLSSSLYSDELGNRIESIVARVGNSVITHSELDERLELFSAQNGTSFKSLPENERRKVVDRILNTLIDWEIQMQFAERVGLTPSPALIDQVLRNTKKPEVMSDTLFEKEVRIQATIDALRTAQAQQIHISNADIESELVKISQSKVFRFNLVRVGLHLNITDSQVERMSKLDPRDADFEKRAKLISRSAQIRRLYLRSDELPGQISQQLLSKRSFTSPPIRTGPTFSIFFPLNWESIDPLETEERHLSEIFVPVENEAQAEVAKATINSIRNKVISGELTFEKISKKLGWISMGEGNRNLEGIAFNLDMKQLSEPFRTKSGWHIVRPDEIRFRRNPELIRTQIRLSLINQRAEQEYQKWLRSIRSSTQVIKL